MNVPTLPLISVLMPVHNGAQYLGEAIESVYAQGYRPIELVVIDDGSTDSSAEIAKRFPVRYCFQERQGPGAARNRGFSESRGAFLAFLDADDLWVPEKLVQQMRALEADSGLDMVFGHVEQFRSPELTNTGIDPPAEPAVPGRIPGAMLIRRHAFERVGGFGTAWGVGEFIDWYARAVELGLTSLMLPQAVLRRRLHRQNLGIRERHRRGDYVRILKESLDRRRRDPGKPA
jgi:glycosyltransferase involved in cell wall biosynthesis